MTTVAIFVHVHYLETWPSLRGRIEQTLAVPFRLFVTTTGAPEEIAEPRSDHMISFEARRVDNRGRDVLPFIEALASAASFDIGLKLHGKRSVHRLDGEAWRDALVGSLLASAAEVERLVDRMRTDPRLGLVGPEASFCSIARHVGGNDTAMRRVAAAFHRPLPDLVRQTPFFSAGTMFWFRADALRSVAAADLGPLFTNERGQTDGTAAHALERLFPALAEKAGHLAVPVNVALASRADTPTAELKAQTLAAVDIDDRFVMRPGAMAAFAMRRLRFVIPLYLALPVPVRRLIKRVASAPLALRRR